MDGKTLAGERKNVFLKGMNDQQSSTLEKPLENLEAHSATRVSQDHTELIGGLGPKSL